MAKIYADRVMETTTTTGTGALTLGGAVTGFRRFSAACAVGDTVDYSIFAVDSSGVPTGAWETGVGTYSATNTLTRTTVQSSSNSNAAVSFASGTKNVLLGVNSASVLTFGVGGGVAAKGARLAQTTGQTIANNTVTAISFDTTPVFDTGGMFNSSNPTRLTATTSGLYLVSASVTWDTNTTNARGVSFIKNGDTSHRIGYSAMSANAFNPANAITALLNLSAGDYIEVAAYQNSGGSVSTLNYTEQLTTFSMVAVPASSNGTGSSPNSVPPDMTLWNAAKARGSSAPARFLMLGDSNAVGQGGGTGTAGLTGAALLSFSHRMAALLGFQDNSFLGDSNITLSGGPSMPTFDPRMTLSGNWQSDSANAIVGGRFLTAAAGSGSLTWTPTGAFTKFRIWWPRTSGIATNVGLTVDGSSVGTIDMTGTAGIGHTDYTVSSGTHTIGLNATGTGASYCMGIEVLDGTSSPIFLNGAHRGAVIADLIDNSQAWSPLSEMPTLAPDFVALYMELNDLNAGINPWDYYTRVETVVRSMISTASGCLMTCFPANSNETIGGRGDQLVLGLRSIAADYGWGFYDTRRVFGHSFTKAYGANLTADNNHPNVAGHTAFAADFAAYLTASGI